jgi:GAF domain-containing protein
MAQNQNLPPTSSLTHSPLWKIFISPHSSINTLGERRQAELSASLAIALALLNLLGGIAAYPQRSFLNLMQVFGIPVAISLIAYFITRIRFFSLGSFLLVAGFCGSGLLTIIRDNAEIRATVLFYVPIALTIGSVLLSSWAIFLLTGLNVGAIFLLPAFGVALPNNIGGVIGLVTAFGIVLIVINNFRQGIEIQRLAELEHANQELMEIQSNLEERVAERTRTLDHRSAQLEAATFVARAAAEVHDIKMLLDNVARQITDRFGFYHVGIFLTDEVEFQVVLAAASSPGGQKMLARGHKLEIGRKGIVGQAAYQKRPRIAQNVEIDATYFNNPDLPETRSEVALPLLAQNNLIGILDIQSKDANAFTPDDVYTLQTMTDQIALAIENSRLIEKNRTAILNLEIANKETAGSTWKKRLNDEVKSYTYTTLGMLNNTGIKSPDEIDDDKEKTLHINLVLRGQKIGNITLKRKSNMFEWSETEKEMAQLIATQVALAIENARLLDDAQRNALREQTVNEFSVRFSRSLDVDTLLQNAVRELHRLPQVADVSILINPVDATLNPG